MIDKMESHETIQLSGVAQVLLLALFSGTLSAVAALAMYYPLYASVPFCILAPLYTAFIDSERFEKLKLLTLILGRVLIVLTFLSLFPAGLLTMVVLWLLRINIAEAVIQDFIKKHYVNAIGGTALMLYSWFIGVEWTGVYYVITAHYLIYWIIAYTVWNWNFVFLNFEKPISRYHVAVLTAPLLFVAVTENLGYWLIMRSGTLVMAVALQITHKKKIDEYLGGNLIINNY